MEEFFDFLENSLPDFDVKENKEIIKKETNGDYWYRTMDVSVMMFAKSQDVSGRRIFYCGQYAICQRYLDSKNTLVIYNLKDDDNTKSEILLNHQIPMIKASLRAQMEEKKTNFKSLKAKEYAWTARMIEELSEIAKEQKKEIFLLEIEEYLSDGIWWNSETRRNHRKMWDDLNHKLFDYQIKIDNEWHKMCFIPYHNIYVVMSDLSSDILLNDLLYEVQNRRGKKNLHLSLKKI